MKEIILISALVVVSTGLGLNAFFIDFTKTLPGSTSIEGYTYLDLFSPVYAQGIDIINNSISADANITSGTVGEDKGNETMSEVFRSTNATNGIQRSPPVRETIDRSDSNTGRGDYSTGWFNQELFSRNQTTGEVALYADVNASLSNETQGTDSLVVLPDRLVTRVVPPSDGVYRIPYEDMTHVRITRDHTDHTPPNRIDMVGINGGPQYSIVAAGDGIVRFIVDDNTINCNSNADVQGNCSDYNNYVWIEHPNGEWTKYSHLETDSVRGDAGLSEGDFVNAGTFLGFESDIGFASGEHLHFEVGIPDDSSNPIYPNGGFIRGENRIPVICDIPNNLFDTGSTYTAEDCEWASLDPSLRFSGLFLRTNEPSSLTGGEWNDFQPQWGSIEGANDYRITDIETYPADGKRFYTGIFRPEGGATTSSWVGVGWNSFKNKWNQWVNGGLDPVDVDAYTLLDGTVRHTGIFRPGIEDHIQVPPVEWGQFTFLWSQLSAHNWRLVDMESYVEGGKTLYTGVFKEGGGAHGLWMFTSLGDLVDKRNEVRGVGAELVDFEVIDTAGGTRFFAGVFLESSDIYRIWYGADWDHFKQRIAAMRDDGYELVDLEVKH